MSPNLLGRNGLIRNFNRAGWAWTSSSRCVGILSILEPASSVKLP